MEPLDRERLEAIVHAAADRLPGRWLLLGGALVAVWISPRRVTEDVDLVGLQGTADDRREIFRLARELGLPVEVVNSAAEYFLEQQPGWREEIEILERGRVGVVYRPTPTLFLLLKIARLSEQDLEDCLSLLAKAGSERLPIDQGRVRAALDALPATSDPGVQKRRASLRSHLRG